MGFTLLEGMSVLCTQARFSQEQLETHNSGLNIIKSRKTFNDFTKDELNKNSVVHFEISSIWNPE